MKKLKILCWNVNGIRSLHKKGFLPWLEKEKPDILLLNEVKACREDLAREVLSPEGYKTFWLSPKEKKGYSGVAIFTRSLPSKVSSGLEESEFDQEGRTLVLEYGDFMIFNIYFPNGKASPERLKYKMDFYEAFLKRAVLELKKGKMLLIGGDVNTAHHPIDLARPKENETISGFLPIEREWMDRFEAAGFVDTFRMFHPEPHQYTWWSLRAGARKRNVGWRIDYFFVSENLKKQVKDAFIMPEVLGSDHCPIGVLLEIPEKDLRNGTTLDEEKLSGDEHLTPMLL